MVFLERVISDGLVSDKALELRVEISSKTLLGFLYDLVKDHCRGRICSGNNDDALYD